MRKHITITYEVLPSNFNRKSRVKCKSLYTQYISLRKIFKRLSNIRGLTKYCLWILLEELQLWFLFRGYTLDSGSTIQKVYYFVLVVTCFISCQ